MGMVGIVTGWGAKLPWPWPHNTWAGVDRGRLPERVVGRVTDVAKAEEVPVWARIGGDCVPAAVQNMGTGWGAGRGAG